MRISARVTWNLEKTLTAEGLGGTGSGKSAHSKYIILGLRV